MNWRKSNRELSALYQRNPWLYVIEWRERLERCVMHLEGVRTLGPGEVEWESGQLREAAADLIALAERWEAQARKVARIATLRNTAGRTPDEAAAYRAKADELEKALEAER